MVKAETKRRIKKCGVCADTLVIGVNCGAYSDLESALDRLDNECPLGGQPDHVVKISRMVLVNNDIDAALFQLAKETSAWTYLEDFSTVFVLMGPESRGMILHERMRKLVPFHLEFQTGKTRFIRFKGDVESERLNKYKKPVFTLFQLLAGKMHMSTTKARDTFEALIRTCDESGWEHTNFPFTYPGAKLDSALRLLKRHKLLIHRPHIIQPHR